MTTRKQFRRRLRVAFAAPWCLLLALLTTGAAWHALQVDGAHKPTEEFNLTTPNITGTLDAARLPANVPTLATDSGNVLSLPDAITFDGGLSGSDDHGNFYLGNSLYLGNSTSGACIFGPSGASWTDDEAGGWIGPQQNSYISTYGSAFFQNGVETAGGFIGDGTDVTGVTSIGVYSPAGASLADDGSGNWNVAGDMSFGSDINSYGTLWIYGNILAGNTSQPVIDADGNVVAANLTADGNLLLGNVAQGGTITPDHTLVICDGSGTPYLIPCTAQ